MLQRNREHKSRTRKVLGLLVLLLITWGAEAGEKGQAFSPAFFHPTYSSVMSQTTNTDEVFSVYPRALKLLAGITAKLQVTSGAHPSKGSHTLSYTPMFGFDHPEIGAITADGTFVAGLEPGHGVITVTVGYQTRRIPVEVEALTVNNPEESRIHSVAGIENEWINLSQTASYQVEYLDPIDPLFQQIEKGDALHKQGLLLGDSAEWTRFYRQRGREITIQLDRMRYLTSIEMTFQQRKAKGITIPPEIEIEVSNDAKEWSYAGKVTHLVPFSTKEVVERTLRLSLPELQVQYVRIRFPVSVFAYGKNLHIYGTNLHQEKKDHASITLPKERSNVVYEDRQAEQQIKNMLLVFHGAHGEQGSWTKSDFLPMVSYVKGNGTIADQLFDTMLFLPYPQMVTTKGEWEAYMDNLFLPHQQLHALDQAMEDINMHLSGKPRIEGVVLTLPYPSPKLRNWGKLDELDEVLSFHPSQADVHTAQRNRLEALKWYMAEVRKRWDEADFRYLKLLGMYWYHEYVDESLPSDKELLVKMAAQIHTGGLRFYWIPYFGAPGIYEWRKYGFDYAFLQPNYYQTREVPIERMRVVADIATRYGMGMELEGDERMLSDMRYYRTYYNQLIAAQQAGIDKKKVYAYYFGSKNLLRAATSREPNVRAIYDLTYQWIKGEFTQEDLLVPELPPFLDR
ncbi:DUF4855 domain-containing protein [Brevibacillus daliensis]|uniref:DUF4855 domain-containing protein n=1 Tax=Brevibacillus daliensis TaxID=2892995 RepID=UPI001E3DA16B|nr:DUF4855 domain-containing protein [Brevibacillus daliensis]